MVQILKKERNERLIALRNEDRKKWTYHKLGREFNISHVRARELYLEWKEKLSTGLEKKGDKGACAF